MEHRYIAVEGPIGVGKTSLVKLLAERLQGRPVLETVEENPFLPAFYKSPAEHAFQTQLFFLLSRYQQQQALTQADLFAQVTVSDYVFAKDRIFATLTLNPDELTLYERVYAALGPRVVQPDLVIYLQARLDVLLSRIKRRARDYERHFDAAYLERLSRAYNDYFFHYGDTPLLVINTSDIDFVHNEADLDNLVSVIRKMRKGVHHYLPLADTRAR
jgi:deoxyguanosine kinase